MSIARQDGLPVSGSTVYKEEGVPLAGVKAFPWQRQRRSAHAVDSKRLARQLAPGRPHFMAAFKALALVPLFPLAGYCLLDQTGISHALVKAGYIPGAILGEGFGHVGLCF